jgi:sterol desaturase/sphingolipid hydroxylase (fatty acid hydroxylase superfamily)
MNTFLQILVVILSYDIFFYYFHRLLHLKWCYPYHKKHHETLDTNWRTTFRADFIENSVSGIGGVVIYGLVYPTISFNALIIGNLYCFLNGFVDHEPRLVNHPVFNWWYTDHHINHHKYFTCNYGRKWLDYLHGTLRKNS